MHLGDVAAATDFLGQVGAGARLLAEAEPAVRTAARKAIEAALGRHDSAEGVVLGGSVWHVAARA
jgi:hypothetical protein